MKKRFFSLLSLTIAISPISAMVRDREKGGQEYKTVDDQNQSMAMRTEQERKKEAFSKIEIAPRGIQNQGIDLTVASQEESCPEEEISPNNNRIDVINKNVVLSIEEETSDFIKTARESDSDCSDKKTLKDEISELERTTMKIASAPLRSILKQPYSVADEERSKNKSRASAQTFNATLSDPTSILVQQVGCLRNNIKDVLPSTLKKQEESYKTTVEFKKDQTAFIPKIIINDAIGSLIKEMRSLEEEIRELSLELNYQKFQQNREKLQQKDAYFKGIAYLSETEDAQQRLLSKEVYRSTFKPAAQKGFEVMKNLPLESTFRQNVFLIKAAASIIEEALNVAYNSMRRSDRVREKLEIKPLEQCIEKRRRSEAIDVVRKNTQEKINAALECLEQTPEKMLSFLASRKRIMQFNDKEILRELLKEEASDNRVKSPVILDQNDDVSSVQEEDIFNQQEIEISLLQQTAINHAIKTCQEALEIVELLEQWEQ